MNLKKNLILFFILLFSLPIRADKLEKGFQCLYRYDYFKAKEYFEASLKKQRAGAAYGLSMIYSLNNNPFYNLDSARHYILLCDSAFQQLKEKERTYLNTWHITADQIISQKELICDKAFQDASVISTVERYNTYMKDFSFCTKAKAALELRNTVAFREAKSKNTSVAFKNFMDTYPDAKEVHEAANHYEERVYEEITADKTIASYEQYLKSVPEGPYKIQAENAVYTLSVPHKTIEEYHAFVKKYPSNRHAE